MEEQQGEPIEPIASEAKVFNPEAACCVNEGKDVLIPDYHYMESEERLNRAFDILFEEADKMLEAERSKQWNQQSL